MFYAFHLLIQLVFFFLLSLCILTLFISIILNSICQRIYSEFLIEFVGMSFDLKLKICKSKKNKFYFIRNGLIRSLYYIYFCFEYRFRQSPSIYVNNFVSFSIFSLCDILFSCKSTLVTVHRSKKFIYFLVFLFYDRIKCFFFLFIFTCFALSQYNCFLFGQILIFEFI